jgi:hypothetical protein
VFFLLFCLLYHVFLLLKHLKKKRKSLFVSFSKRKEKPLKMEKCFSEKKNSIKKMTQVVSTPSIPQPERLREFFNLVATVHKPPEAILEGLVGPTWPKNCILNYSAKIK